MISHELKWAECTDTQEKAHSLLGIFKTTKMITFIKYSSIFSTRSFYLFRHHIFKFPINDQIKGMFLDIIKEIINKTWLFDQLNYFFLFKVKSKSFYK